MDSIVEKIARTALRSNYERARNLGQEEQLSECIELLQNPQLISVDVKMSFEDVRQAFAQGVVCPELLAERSERFRQNRNEPRWFYEGRDLSVIRGSYAFTVLSSDVEPLPITRGGGTCQGLDYVGLRCDSSNAPVLGVVQSELDTSPYPLLLRLIASLAEIAPAAQVERANAQYFKLTLPRTPCFDLTLVTWEYQDDAERTPVSQLTRDMAEVVKNAINQMPKFPGILRDIVCLRMNPDRFDGRLRFDWSV